MFEREISTLSVVIKYILFVQVALFPANEVVPILYFSFDSVRQFSGFVSITCKLIL